MFCLTNLHIYIIRVTLNHTKLLLLKEKRNSNRLPPMNTCFCTALVLRAQACMLASNYFGYSSLRSVLSWPQMDQGKQHSKAKCLLTHTHTLTPRCKRGFPPPPPRHKDLYDQRSEVQRLSHRGRQENTHIRMYNPVSLSLSLSHTHTHTLVHCTSTKMSHYCTST